MAPSVKSYELDITPSESKSLVDKKKSDKPMTTDQLIDNALDYKVNINRLIGGAEKKEEQQPEPQQKQAAA